jgi:hypothetical protein
MKKLAMFAALLSATAPVQAQVATSNGQELLGGQIGQSAASQAPTTGVICEEEMTATFCNVVTGPNNAVTEQLEAPRRPPLELPRRHPLSRPVRTFRRPTNCVIDDPLRLSIARTAAVTTIARLLAGGAML